MPKGMDFYKMENLFKVVEKVCCFGLVFFVVVNNKIIVCAENDKATECILQNENDTIQKSRTTLTESESLGLQKIAIAEGYCDGPVQMAYIMQTVLNRVEDPRFPNTVDEVIKQDNQFTTYRNGDYNKAIPDSESELALELCFMLENNGQLYFDMKQNTNTWITRNHEVLFDYMNHNYF